MKLKDRIAAMLAERVEVCACNFPEDGEDGIIYCLACELREVAGLPPHENHARSAAIVEAREARP